MFDVTKELSEAQQAALFTLLTYANLGIAASSGTKRTLGVRRRELARLCLLEAWPVDDWNRRIADSDAEYKRQTALLEKFRPEPIAE